MSRPPITGDRFCDHLLLHSLAAPMTLRWLRGRFAGRPLKEHRIFKAELARPMHGSGSRSA